MLNTSRITRVKMIKKINKIVLFFIVGAVCMVNAYGCANRFKFESYSGKDPGLRLTIDYPSGWVYSEHKGEAGIYVGVVFFEDKKGDVPKALVGLTVKDSSKTRLEPQTLQAFVDDLIADRKRDV